MNNLQAIKWWLEVCTQEYNVSVRKFAAACLHPTVRT